MRSTIRQTFPDCSNLVGIPYSRLNCWDLCVEFYKLSFKTDLKQYYDQKTDDKFIALSLIRANERDFVKTKNPNYGDLITIKIMGVESHIAVYLGDGLMLHTTKNTGSVVDRVSRWHRMICGYYTPRMETT